MEQDKASALLGVGGVGLLEVDREGDGRVTVWVGTSDPDAAVCPDCQTRAGRVHERVLDPASGSASGPGPGRAGVAQAALEVRQPRVRAGDVHRGGGAGPRPGRG